VARLNKLTGHKPRKVVGMARTIEISDETFEKLKTQLGEDCYKDITSLSDMVGEKFYFRTVTYHLTGRVKKVIGSILELENAAWIADSGRFMNAIKEGKLNEVEPVGRAYINIQSVTDFFPWKHALPEKQI
jgi:hypothetical protein